ncbi:hypothetical protein [Streptomyces sp. NPDC014006]|uniref:hypothetical protein n=1 Tax=Streptomyces sp. NPDC014006 TaxID=3364870 RepID=UPI0036FAAB81
MRSARPCACVLHPERDRHGCLAAVDGHQGCGGLAWQEVLDLAGSAAADAAGVRDVHARPLLLFTALGDAGRPAGAPGPIADALRWAGVPAEHPPVARVAAARLPPVGTGRVVPSAPVPVQRRHRTVPGRPGLRRPAEAPRHGVRTQEGISGERSEWLARALGTWT